MSLYYHIGSSGAGKTTGVQERIIREAEADKERSFLFIVPEQFTLQTQREILEKSKSGGMLNIDALSFARLAHRVFEELGVSLPQVLEDTGKSMIVKKMLLEHKDELTIYKGKVKKQGFAEEMKSIIAEFYQYGIDSDRFENMKRMAGKRGILKAKLHDIEIIYNAFAKFIDGRFVMNEEVLDKMCEVASKSELIRDSAVVFDGFTGFTPSQYNCIDKLMKYAGDIHVVLTIDSDTALKTGENKVYPADRTAGNLKDNEEGKKDNKDYTPQKLSLYKDDLFELSIKTINRLEELAIKNNIPSGFVIYDGKKGRHSKNPCLAHLEQNIFRFPYKKSADHSAVTLLSASEQEEEADFIVSKILEVIAGAAQQEQEGISYDSDIGNKESKQQTRYQDIAILTGDLASYAPIFERKLLQAGIPYFIDRKKNISSLSIVEFIDSCLDIIISDFSYENVFRFLKTGFTGMDKTDISVTENYVIAKGIKGYRRWSYKWKGKEKDPETENELRSNLLELVKDIKKSEDGKEKPTVTERLTYLYGLLDECNVEEKLYNTSEALKISEKTKDRIKGTELGQAFKTIVTVFERINSLLGDERMPLEEFKEILDTGFNEAKLRSIPGGIDSVVVGDVERTRINNKKIIFFAGCSDSVIPGNKQKGSLLNEYDRELFAENDIELSPTLRESFSLNEFYMYLALTRPSEKLYLSYSKKSGDSKEGRPAYIFGKLMKLYEGLEVQKLSEYEKDSIFRTLGSDMGLNSVIGLLRGENFSYEGRLIRQILKEIFEKENLELIEKLEKAALGKRAGGRLSAAEAEKLYGKVILGSTTRLQQFAACAFSHFAKYGLKLKERQEYRIGGMELGNIYHAALKEYALSLKKDKKKWSECIGGERIERENEAMNAALKDYEEIVSSTKRYEYIKKSLSRVFGRTVDIVSKQIAAGKFDVGFIEKSFTHEGEYMKLTGIIDRLDVAEKNGRTYFRVIDYKTGSTTFEIEKVKAGLQLQLAIYTAEAAKLLFEQEKTILPAGMYYYKIDDPIIEVKTADKEDGTALDKASEEKLDDETEKAIMKELRLNGLTVADNEILGLHDASIISKDGNRVPKITSEVIKYRSKSDATLYEECERNIIDAETFAGVSKTAIKKADEFAKSILEGDVSVNPYQHGSMENACNYCIFRSVCKFDKRLGDRFRPL